MYGKMLNTIINIMFITYLLLLVSFYFLHEGVKENINNLNYSIVDSVATSGTFSVDLYNNLKERVLSYGGPDCHYTMLIRYEQKKADGKYETFFIKDNISSENVGYPVDDEALRNQVDPSKIITVPSLSQVRPMYKGDQITIYLEDQNQTLYGKLITMPFMGMLGSHTDFRIKSLKASMIGRDATKLYNGYEVIDDINRDRDYIVQLRTEISSTTGVEPRTYNPGVKYVGTGDEALSASGANWTIGTFHIFNTGRYYRVWNDGGTTGTIDGKLGTGDIVVYYQTTD